MGNHPKKELAEVANWFVTIRQPSRLFLNLINQTSHAFSAGHQVVILKFDTKKCSIQEKLVNHRISGISSLIFAFIYLLVVVYLIKRQIIVSVIIATGAHGFTLNLASDGSLVSSDSHKTLNFPLQPFQRIVQNVNDGPIAGHPKVPPANAFESGGLAEDLLPPLEDPTFRQGKNLMFRRSIDQVKVDPKTGYSLIADASWKDAGGNEGSLHLPLVGTQRSFADDAVDPKTGYPLKAQESWKYAGGDEQSLQLPLLDAPTGGSMPKAKEEVDPKTGYPLQAKSSWSEAGGTGDILELPLEDSNLDANVDPKTGYPLVAQSSWSDAGGNGDILQVPVDDTNLAGKVDPKTGYPLLAEAGWSEAGGTGDILQAPLEDGNVNAKIDPHTKYPLGTGNSWSADSDMSQVPAEDVSTDRKVDPKTGYPLQAENGWSDAGGNGDFLQPPLEESNTNVPTDPKTGYPLIAESGWKDAGGTGDILELPIDDSNSAGKVDTNAQPKVDPKTGYPLVAESSWKDAGGNGDILQLPLENTNENGAVDPKTGYPLQAQPNWKDAGGDGQILVPPPVPSNNGRAKTQGQEGKVDPKTGYPLTAEPGWALAGGDESILDLPVGDYASNEGSYQQQQQQQQQNIDDIEALKLMELKPPAVDSTYSTGYQDSEGKQPAAFQSSFLNPAHPANGFLVGNSNPSVIQQQQQQFVSGTPETPVKNLLSLHASQNDVAPVAQFLGPNLRGKQIFPAAAFTADKFVQNGLTVNDLIANHGNLFQNDPRIPTLIVHRSGVQPSVLAKAARACEQTPGPKTPREYPLAELHLLDATPRWVLSTSDRSDKVQGGVVVHGAELLRILSKEATVDWYENCDEFDASKQLNIKNLVLVTCN
ncbi:hypothetical protein RUM44_013751 [Polyplax serrata]|uniref:Uncharacterized protein n=1 Tax=Polyplax serrata TaxID=468196 RepID=A0ABR1BF12_POLSC